MNFSNMELKKQNMTHKYESGKRLATFYDNKLKLLDNRIAILRLISTITLLAVIFSLFDKNQILLNSFFILSFLIFCLVTSWLHNTIQTKQKKWNEISSSYNLNIARIERNFSLLNEYKSPWHESIIKVPEGHIYSHDLDIHSHLFKLLDTCTTKEGTQKLFHLLMTGGISPESLETINNRTVKAKSLVREPILLRRMETLKLSESSIEKIEKSPANKEEEFQFTTKKSIFYILFTVLNLFTWTILLIPAILKYLQLGLTEPLIQGLLTYGLFLILGIYIFSPITKSAEKIAYSSKKIELIIKTLKNNSRINETLNLSFLSTASLKKIKNLNILLSLLDLRGNIIFWITMHLFFPFDAVLCLLLERKMKNLNNEMNNWEQELHQFDLLCAFARFKIENPKSHFLTFSERSSVDNKIIAIENIGHPHLSDKDRVTNSIKLSLNSPVVLLTGSNMAGKSTFLRTLGTNLLLANIGAPIIADTFQMAPSRILCAIRIDDSLAEGTSYFYAEVKRLKFILEALNNTQQSTPGFFLIDEIFRGTNNKERYIGSFNIILDLFTKNSFGFISTHDLALAEIEKTDHRLVNMHFKEHIEENKLAFDYKLKDGPCPTTNALFIMRQEGLPVPATEV